MKKIMLTAAACIALVGSIFLASCGKDNGFSIDSEIDTVLNLEAPQVKVSAYPGMNYVSWKPVANANGYVVYVYEDGHNIDAISLSYDVLNYKDLDIKNGAEYTYYVEAESKSSTGRSVVTENKMSEPVSVKGIVPPYNTKSLDLNNFEKGVDSEGNGVAGNVDYVLSSSNLHVAKDGFDKFSISFPGKAYLNYDVFVFIDNEFESVGITNYIPSDPADPLDNFVDNYKDNASNDRILYAGERPVTKAGVYHVDVVAHAENDHFGSSAPVTATETVTVEQLNGTLDDTDTNYTAAYCNATTIRVKFPKFVRDDGSDAPLTWYKVFRSTADRPYNYTAVGTGLKKTNSTGAELYFEDTVEDNTVKYIYTFAVTDGKRFAKNNMTTTVDPYALGAQDDDAVEVLGAATIKETDNTANDITWTITLADSDISIKSIKILEIPANDADGHTVVAADFEKAVALTELNRADDETGLVYNVFTKDHPVGKKVYLLVTTEQEDKADAEWISNAVTINKPACSVTGLAISAYTYDNTKNFSNDSPDRRNDDIVVAIQDVIDLATDKVENYTYELQMAESTVKADKAAGTITFKYGTNWTKLADITLADLEAYDTSKTSATYVADYKDATKIGNKADGVYSFRVIKTCVATGVKKTSKVATVIVDTSSSIIYVPGGKDGITDNLEPGITADWASTTGDKETIEIKFTKDNTVNEYGYNLNKPSGGSYPISVVPESAETGVSYVVYRAVFFDKATDPEDIYPYDLVFDKVGPITAQSIRDYNKNTYEQYEWDGNTPVSKGIVEYTDNIDFATTDADRSTGCSYVYVVVASKAGCADRYSNFAYVLGAN